MNLFKINMFSISLYGLILWMLVVSIFNIGDSYLKMGLIVFLILPVFALYLEHQYRGDLKNKFGLVLTHYSNPKPLSTMLDALIANNYLIAEIKSITAVSYDLGHACDYMKKSKAANHLFRKNKNIKFKIIGFSDDKNLNIACDTHTIDVAYANKKLIEHKNLIIMEDGTALLWYEPSHIVKNDRDSFMRGAYLIKINDETQQSIEKEYVALAA